ncbi:MAG: hypothetical protein ACI8X5_004108, partial [Planctomycetota bacterium]
MSRGQTKRALGTLRTAARELLAVRWVRWTAIMAVLVLTVRVGMVQLLGATVNQLAERYDLECDWDAIDLSITTGWGQIHDFEIRPLPSAESPSPEALLFMEYAVFDLDVLELLRGKLSIARAEVDGLQAELVRRENGEWDLGQHFPADEILAFLKQRGQEEAPVADSEDSNELNLTVPLAISALRFQNARLHLLDETLDPPTDLSFEVNAALSDLNEPLRPMRISCVLLGGKLLGGAQLNGEATWDSDALHVKFNAGMSGLHPAVLERYLENLDIRAACEVMTGQLSADLHVAVTGVERDTLEARLDLSDIHLKADGVEELALDRITVEVDSYSPASASLPGIEIRGVRGRASLEADSALRIAGLEFTGMRWAESTSELLEAFSSEEKDESGFPSWLALLLEKDAEAYAWSLGSLNMRDGVIDFTDRTVTPESRFPLYVDLVGIGEVAHVPGEDAHTIEVETHLRVPGLAETIDLTGSVGPFAPKRSIDLELQVKGIALETLAPRIRGFGVEHTLADGTFHAKLIGEAETDKSGRTEGELTLEKISLDNQGQLFGVESMRATGILFDPEAQLLRFSDMEVTGTQLSFGRDSTKRFFALGLRTLGISPDAESTSTGESEGDQKAIAESETANRPAASNTVRQWPVIEFGRLAVVGSRFEFIDEFLEPALTFDIEDLGFELIDLTLGGKPGGKEHPPASFKAQLSAPGVLEELILAGSIHSQPGPINLSLDLTLRGNRGSTELVETYLHDLGVDPAYRDASLEVGLAATLQEQADGWTTSIAMSDAALRNGALTLVSFDKLDLEDVKLGQGLEVGNFSLLAPHIHIRRSAEEELFFAGVRMLSEQLSASQAPSKEAATALSLPALPKLRLVEAHISGARVSFSDASFEPELSTEVLLSANLLNLSTDGTPAAFDVHLQIPETVEELTAYGTLAIGDGEIGVVANTSGSGLRAGPLAQLLPNGVDLGASEAAFQGSFQASIHNVDAGGLGAKFQASDVSWGTPGSTPWIAVESGVLIAPRIDPVARIVTLGPIEVDGLQLQAARDLDGAMRLLGLVLSSPVADDQPAEEKAEGQESPAISSNGLQIPRVEFVEKVRLSLAHAEFRDETLGANALPIEASATFQLKTPIVVVDTDPLELKPIEWELAGAIPGLVKHWSLSGEITPFASEPRFEAKFEATGVRTTGIIERAPGLEGLLEGEVEEGTFTASATGTLSVRRARPTELGISRPFGAELLIESVEYRDEPNGQILAGVDEVAINAKRIDLANSIFHLDTVEILTPRGKVRRNGMTLHALGLAVHLDSIEQPKDEELPPKTSAPVPDVQTVSASAKLDTVAPKPSPAEVRIDNIIVSGLDFDILDQTSDPAVHIPLNKLDAEFSHFSTRGLTEPRPFQFSAYLESAPESGIGLFDEIALAGRVSVFPSLDGWVQLSASGVELAELAPLAAMNGLDLDDGALDSSVRIRLQGAEGLDVNTSIVFTDLNMAEAQGGFLESLFTLPVGLDTALFMLKNADDEHRFSVGFSIDDEGLSLATLAGAGASAFSEVLIRAIAAVPMRVLTSLIPGGDTEEETPSEVWSLPFSPATTELGPEQLIALQVAAERLQDDDSFVLVLRHELCPEDVARADRLANPASATCLEIVEGLRQRKAQVLRARSSLSSEAHALYAIGDERASEATQGLLEKERELASIENS